MFKTIPLWLIFTGLVIIISSILFTLPINLFPGEIIEKKGISEIRHQDVNISLSYFIGMGMNPGDLEGIKSFRLTSWGWALACCYILLLPGIITLRISMKRKETSK